jgi:hypothetical protein
LFDWVIYQLSRDNDIYLSTLPSSGTHWLRFIIAKGLVDAYDLDYEFTDIQPHDVVPPFRNKDERFAFNDQTNVPRVQHTHKSYSFLLRDERVIVLVRDLRDTMVSSYDTYSERIDPSISFAEFLRADGVDEDRHRTLEHRISFLNGWAKNWQKLNDHLCVKYESLKREPHETTRTVFDFIGIDGTTDELVESATRVADIEHMRYIEQHGEANPDIGTEDTTETASEAGAKINEGTTKRYGEYFDEADKQYFKRVIDEQLEDDFGYDYETF